MFQLCLELFPVFPAADAQPALQPAVLLLHLIELYRENILVQRHPVPRSFLWVFCLSAYGYTRAGGFAPFAIFPLCPYKTRRLSKSLTHPPDCQDRFLPLPMALSPPEGMWGSDGVSYQAEKSRAALSPQPNPHLPGSAGHSSRKNRWTAPRLNLALYPAGATLRGAV